MLVVLGLGCLVLVFASLAWVARAPPAAPPEATGEAPLPDVAAEHEQVLAEMTQVDQALHAAYLRGDLARMNELLPMASRSLSVSLTTSLGRYAEALECLGDGAAELDPDAELTWHEWLVRVNACEALVELGEFTKARALLERPHPTDAFMLAAITNTFAWLLAMKGEHHAALTRAEQVVEGDLSEEYAAEAPMVHALCLMNLGRLDEAKAPLALAWSRLVRASSRKNVELLEARWHALAGDRTGAMQALQTALADPWTAQGGSGYLALGDAFAARGWLDEARTAWSKATEDAESSSARTAHTRLSTTTH